VIARAFACAAAVEHRQRQAVERLSPVGAGGRRRVRTAGEPARGERSGGAGGAGVHAEAGEPVVDRVPDRGRAAEQAQAGADLEQHGVGAGEADARGEGAGPGRHFGERFRLPLRRAGLDPQCRCDRPRRRHAGAGLDAGGARLGGDR
jgi:hypothetical protein